MNIWINCTLIILIVEFKIHTILHIICTYNDKNEILRVLCGLWTLLRRYAGVGRAFYFHSAKVTTFSFISPAFFMIAIGCLDIIPCFYYNKMPVHLSTKKINDTSLTYFKIFYIIPCGYHTLRIGRNHNVNISMPHRLMTC